MSDQLKIQYNGKWHRPFENLFIYVSDNIKNTRHIAAFDLDNTLTVTKSGNKFAKYRADIMLMEHRLRILKSLYKSGYTIIIFTNQKSTTDKRKEFSMDKIINFIRLIKEIPIILLMSTGNDEYRKPSIGMWTVLNKIISPINSAFYVGDAAGRPNDFSDSDKKFAENIKIPFYTPEEFFV